MVDLYLKLTSVEVKAETRELSCNFSREMAKSLKAFHGFQDTSYRRINRMAAIINIFNIDKHDS